MTNYDYFIKTVYVNICDANKTLNHNYPNRTNDNNKTKKNMNDI